MVESHGFAHRGEDEVPAQLEAGSQSEELLFASGRLLHFFKKKNSKFYDKMKEDTF